MFKDHEWKKFLKIREVDNLQDIDFLKKLTDVKKVKTILYTKQTNILTVDKLLQQAAQIEPSNFHVWYAWGIIKKLQDDLAAAEKYLRKALVLRPYNTAALCELGRVLTFKRKYREAEEIFLGILEAKLDISSIKNTDITFYIADNYANWANDEFNKKAKASWMEKARNAFESVLVAIDFAPSDGRIHELHKKICLDFGLHLFQIGNKEKGEKFLVKTIAEIRIYDQLISTNKETLSLAYYHLAKHEMSKTHPNWNLTEIYVRKGLAVSNKPNRTNTLKKYKKIVKNEKRRKIGQISSFDPDKKFGIIKSKDRSCIFFPNCLSWYCSDIPALINRKVSFIPVQHTTARRSKNLKATQIKLVEAKT